MLDAALPLFTDFSVFFTGCCWRLDGSVPKSSRREAWAGKGRMAAVVVKMEDRTSRRCLDGVIFVSYSLC